jgi:hypothetical protein
MPTLKRTQMYFPEATLAELRKRASAESTTIAEIVRSAVSDYLRKDTEKNWEEDPLWEMIGSGSSREGDLSVHHDRYLYGKK